MIIQLEFIRNPNIVLSLLSGLLGILFIINLLAKRAGIREKWIIPDLRFGNGQTIGNREKQEDSFATDVKEHGVFAMVADGIGSFVNGRITSRMAVQSFLEEFGKGDISGNIPYFFKRTALSVNAEIKAMYGDIPSGTTVVAALIQRNKLYYAWAGDSTIAIYRKGTLIPLNRKDNVGNKLEDLYHSGQIPREEVLQTPYKERLVNYLGQDEFKGVSIHEREITLKKGDRVLLYSDGLETLSKIEMEEILKKRKSPHVAARELIHAINKKEVNEKDNATVVILHVKHEYKG